jgi:predicted peroxiredoxin
VLIRKGEPTRNEQTMTVIMSTASLENAVYPLDKALAGAVLGMNVNMVVEGAAVRLLKRGYRPRFSGLVGGLFTSKAEGVMKDEIGWPRPQESILILEDLGARFFVCGPSMFGYGVHEQDLIVGKYTLGRSLPGPICSRAPTSTSSLKRSSTSPSGRAESLRSSSHRDRRARRHSRSPARINFP